MAAWKPEQPHAMALEFEKFGSPKFSCPPQVGEWAVAGGRTISSSRRIRAPLHPALLCLVVFAAPSMCASIYRDEAAAAWTLTTVPDFVTRYGTTASTHSRPATPGLKSGPEANFDRMQRHSSGYIRKTHSGHQICSSICATPRPWSMADP